MSYRNPAALTFQGVSRHYGSTQVLHQLSFEVLRGEFVAIVGPSGCGKTTLLNAASQFDREVSGAIRAEGQIRMVHQKDGLFPWLTVEENIGLGLRHMKDKRQREAEISELINLIQLQAFRKHYPHELSGGMRQRAELARALGGQSDILLLDEPFSALDYLTRMHMRRELARMLAERPKTVLLVTHDIEEAAQLADRIFVLTARPATIQFEVSIGVPRPRDVTHPEVVSAVEQILNAMGLQEAREVER